MTPACLRRPDARYGDADFAGGADGAGGALLAGAGGDGALVAGGLFTVTLELGWTDGDVGSLRSFRYLAMRMAAMTMARMTMMTMMMLRNVWSGRGGGPGGWPQPG